MNSKANNATNLPVTTTPELAKDFFLSLDFSKTVVELNGELGAGKTQFVRWGLEHLASSMIQSPTYSLINTYMTTRGVVQHLDFYRLKEIEELEGIGFWDLFQSDQLLLIEWADRFGPIGYPHGWNTHKLQFSKSCNRYQLLVS